MIESYVRCVRPDDRIGHASPAERTILENRRHRATTMIVLAELLERRKREMIAEQRKERPNMGLIARYRDIISSLQSTLNKDCKTVRR